MTAGPASSSQDALLLSRMCWTTLAAMAFAVWISFASLRLRVDPTSNIPLAMGGLAYMAVALFYSRIRCDRRIAEMLVVIAQLFLALFLPAGITFVIHSLRELLDEMPFRIRGRAWNGEQR